MRPLLRILPLCALAAGGLAALAGTAPVEPAGPRRVDQDAVGRIAPAFEANLGQADPRAPYLLRAGDTGLFFTPKGVRISLPDPEDRSLRWGLAMEFPGTSADPAPLDPLPGSVSYFTGTRDEWVTGAPTYSGLSYRGLWEGVDLVFGSEASRLKYELVVAPGADPSEIRMRWRGATSLEPTADGSLLVHTPAGTITDERPVSYQVVEGRRVEIPTSYRLAGETVGFSVGDYHRRLPLVIDPAMFVYAGFIGGTGSDVAWGLAADANGAAYVAGEAVSTQATFPVSVGPDLTHNGGADAFIAKIDPQGTGLEYAGYIGGSGNEEARDVEIDATGAAYVFGQTQSDQTTFPVLGGPDLTHNGMNDGFIAKVNPQGTGLVYAGYVGGTGIETGNGVAVDGAGAAYVTGQTTSADFPAIVGPDNSLGGFSDAYVAKVNPQGTTLEYAGYIGGDSLETGNAIAIDGAGAAFVTGQANSDETTFPETIGPDLTQNGDSDAYVAKVNPQGTALQYAGFIGGDLGDFGNGIAVDGAGAAYVTGVAQSAQTTFPVSVGPDLTHNGGSDAFIAKVSPQGTGFAYAGYIGGTASDSGTGIDVDPQGAAYVGGDTASDQTTFPVSVGPDLTYAGNYDLFVAKVGPQGTGLVYAGYIGGTGTETGYGLAVDPGGNAYMAGETDSADLPTVVGPDPSFNGGTVDGVVAKIGTTETCMGKPTTHLGGAGADTITGTPGGDVVLAGAGDDSIATGSGRDIVCAEAGNDVVAAGGGKDTAQGGPGKDVLKGQGGNDVLKGQGGNDRLAGGPRNDVLNGGPGKKDRCRPGPGKRDRLRSCEL